MQIVENLTDDHVGQLHLLLQKQWWAPKRTLEQTKVMVENTDLMLGLIDSSDQLIGYGRVLTGFVFRATIFDVIVDDDHQGQGQGKYLMEYLSNHERIKRSSRFTFVANRL